MSPHVKNKQKILFVLNARYGKAVKKRSEDGSACKVISHTKEKIKEARLFSRSQVWFTTEGEIGKRATERYQGIE